MNVLLQPGIALDIDETLSSTCHVWYSAMLQELGNPENRTLESLIEEFIQNGEIRYWEVEKQNEWIEKNYSDNRIYENIPLIENANHVVEKIDTLIPISCYMTARPEAVRTATKQWLDRHGFPDRPLIMKPNELGIHGHNEWKAKILEQYYPTVRGIIDDNPLLIEALPENYNGTVFLYGKKEYTHETLINIIPCKNWNVIDLEISRMAHLFGLIRN